MESINKKLMNFYSQNWEELVSALREKYHNSIKSAWPLLIKINEEKFNKSDIRVMIFGRETNEWGEEANEKTAINDLMNCYYNFTDSEGDFNVKYYTPFWNFTKLFITTLKDKFNNKFNNKNIYPIYNNIFKIGMDDKNAGSPHPDITKIEKEYFPVIIKSELEILKPNIILFLTGHNWDNRIGDIFSDIIIKKNPVGQFQLHELAKLELQKPEIENTPFIFRTEHPQTLYFQGSDSSGEKRYKIILNTIIDQIDCMNICFTKPIKKFLPPTSSLFVLPP